MSSSEKTIERLTKTIEIQVKTIETMSNELALPVSYTHLDVYKRQDIYLYIFIFELWCTFSF
ncbi:hypothetical protein A5869_000525 [Enterococcus cecorum]|uniref:Uncharacterized protein n=1 Tax=Enterococcus cecorum TaxID=44008 RepID=A0A200I3K0_9ENTE|nr:hypothetical protein A5869_000525 [Enterococcus cecorum]